MEFVNTGALQGIYPAFPVTGGISQTPKERKPLGGSGEALSFLHKQVAVPIPKKLF